MYKHNYIIICFLDILIGNKMKNYELHLEMTQPLIIVSSKSGF